MSFPNDVQVAPGDIYGARRVLVRNTDSVTLPAGTIVVLDAIGQPGATALAMNGGINLTAALTAGQGPSTGAPVAPTDASFQLGHPSGVQFAARRFAAAPANHEQWATCGVVEAPIAAGATGFITLFGACNARVEAQIDGAASAIENLHRGVCLRFLHNQTVDGVAQCTVLQVAGNNTSRIAGRIDYPPAAAGSTAGNADRITSDALVTIPVRFNGIECFGVFNPGAVTAAS